MNEVIQNRIDICDYLGISRENALKEKGFFFPLRYRVYRIKRFIFYYLDKWCEEKKQEVKNET